MRVFQMDCPFLQSQEIFLDIKRFQNRAERWQHKSTVGHTYKLYVYSQGPHWYQATNKAYNYNYIILILLLSYYFRAAPFLFYNR